MKKIIRIASATALALAFATPAFAASLTRDLSFGMTGADVSDLQSFLAEDPTVYPQGLVTGLFGQLTEAAVVRFQNKNGISAVGRVGPITRAAINAQMIGGTGGNNDVSAPTIFQETVSSSQNSVTATWATNEGSFGRVMYGTSWPFLFAIAPSVSTNNFTNFHSATINGLASNSLYFYVIESKDISGNLSYSLSRAINTK